MDSVVVVVLFGGDDVKSPFSAFLTFFRGGLGSSTDGIKQEPELADWLAID